MRSQLAEVEGVSLNQYIVYALTRQASLACSIQTVPEAEVEQQQQVLGINLSRDRLTVPGIGVL